MYKASADVTLPTSIIGSLPRPSWYTANLGWQNFLEAMMNLRYREQYEDAVSVYLRAQETAGLDIVTDGDAHFDEQISGMSWQSYPLTRGREGMSRRHAAYKMVAMVQGTNLVRRELGLPEAECLAADPRYSLATPR